MRFISFNNRVLNAYKILMVIMYGKFQAQMKHHQIHNHYVFVFTWDHINHLHVKYNCT